MSLSHPNQSTGDRNLLFGILALQMDFISRDALIQAMHAWVLDKAKPLGQILVEQGALAAGRRAVLEAFVQEHVQQHDNDPGRSLALLPPAPSIHAELSRIADPELHASLAHVGTMPSVNCDPHASGSPPSLGTPTSSGLRFRIVRPHAKGGLGEVFVAVDDELRREVALKEIQLRYADDAESRTRFLREAEITGSLEHPGVVPVYGLGEYADGRPFYAMRFIRGQSLQAAIDCFHQAEGPGRDAGARTVELRQLLGRFVAVCNTMAYVHSRGVIHRDLKPGNVMLGPYGETLVVDWGLAKVIGQPEASAVLAEPCLATMAGDDSDLTQAGRALGTPAFMSPEQAAGRLDQLGPASDGYSLGATLYCLLTGKAPFSGADVGVLLANVQSGEFPPPRQKNPQVPVALEAICLKAMSLAPGERYVSAKALADDLEHWLADEPVTAHAEPWRARLGRWVRRHKGLVGSAVAACLVALTVAVAWSVVATAQNLRAEADQNRAEANRQRGLVRRLLYFSRIKNAELAWHDNQMVLMEDLLKEQQQPQPGQEDLPGFEWNYLWRLRHSWLLNCQGHTGPVFSVAFSPDGQRLASASEDGTVKVWDATTGKDALSLQGHTSGVNSVAFSPDGRRLASASHDKTVKVWDATTGQEILSLQGHTEPVTSVVFSQDGSRLASASDDQTVKVWDATTGKDALSLQGHTSYVYSVAFSPDGRRLASASGDQTVKVWDAITGQETLTLKGHTARVSSVAFSPDGRRLASASFDKTVKVWDATTGQEALSLKGHTRSVKSVAFSPDGRSLASASWDRTVKVWEAGPTTPEVFRQREATFLVDSLYLKLIKKAQVIQHLRGDPLLGDALRQEALAQAEQFRPDPNKLNEASWAAVRQASATTADYRQALVQAKEACRLAPDNGLILNTLGVAQYRAGQYPQALETLTHSEKLNAPANQGSLPADLAFLAMTQHRLGQRDQAQATLERLQQRMKEPHLARNQEARGFLAEAEALLLGHDKAARQIPRIP